MANATFYVFVICYLLFALIFGACWQYAINTALDFADKPENYISFGEAYILGLIPFINGMSIIISLVAFAATIIVPLFL